MLFDAVFITLAFAAFREGLAKESGEFINSAIYGSLCKMAVDRFRRHKTLFIAGLIRGTLFKINKVEEN